MAPFKLLLSLGALAVAVPAQGGITVIGSTSARLCYEAAESKMNPTLTSLSRCNEALDREGLSRYDTVATYVNRGILRMRVGRLDEAIADFDRAIAIDPGEAEAYLNKGMAKLQRDNGWAEAVPLFNEALEKETSRPAIAYYGRAVAHELGGNVRQAYLDYRQASALAPKWRDPQVELARFTVVRR